MTDSLWLWIGFNVFVLAMLALDLGVFHRKAHVVTLKESLSWTVVWVGLALLFNFGVWHNMGPQKGLEFFTGYVIEKSLSVDNVFVFALLFSCFAVPPLYQHKVLFWGILGALIMRAIMIFLGAETIIDGTRQTLDEKWIYWEGPGFKSALPIKWKIVDDPVDKGTVLMTDDRAADGGKYGAADIVTKKAHRDFRLHIEFLITKPGGNSGVYLQNRYEIQIFDGDKTKHGLGAVINETESPYHLYKGLGQWNAYDITFRGARFTDGKLTEKARVSMYFNGVKCHDNVAINQVWGGPNSGLDGGNDGGKGLTDTPAA